MSQAYREENERCETVKNATLQQLPYGRAERLTRHVVQLLLGHISNKETLCIIDKSWMGCVRMGYDDDGALLQKQSKMS